MGLSNWRFFFWGFLFFFLHFFNLAWTAIPTSHKETYFVQSGHQKKPSKEGHVSICIKKKCTKVYMFPISIIFVPTVIAGLHLVPRNSTLPQSWFTGFPFPAIPLSPPPNPHPPPQTALPTSFDNRLGPRGLSDSYSQQDFPGSGPAVFVPRAHNGARG